MNLQEQFPDRMTKPTMQNHRLTIDKQEFKEQEKLPSFRSLNYTFCKGEKVFSYGPTSFRCANMGTSTEAHYFELWNKIKAIRSQWKADHGYLIEKDETLMTTPLCMVSAGSLLESLCSYLPHYHQVLESAKKFFSSELFENFPIIDPSKVYADISTCLVHTESSENSKIIAINLGQSKNFYRVGIITEILSLVYYENRVPTVIELFHKFITSVTRGKAAYVERAQFLMLRYMLQKVKGFTINDDTSFSVLTNMAHSTMICIGVFSMKNHNLYRDQPVYLLNLIAFLLYVDFEVSFSSGCPLLVGEQFEIDIRKTTEADGKQDNFGKFVGSIIFLRMIMREIYESSPEPSVESLIGKVEQFHLEKFGFLYLDPGKSEHDLRTVITLLFIFQLISDLYIIRDRLLGNHVLKLRKNSLYYQLCAFRLLLSCVRMTFDRVEGALVNYSYFDLVATFFLFHTTGPRSINDLFSSISKAALFEKSFPHAQFGESIQWESILDVDSFIERLQSYLYDGNRLQIDVERTVDIIDKHYQTFDAGVSIKLRKLLDQSYIFVIANTFTKLMKSSIHSILKKISFEPVNEEFASIFEVSLWDFPFGEDFLSQDL